MSRWVIDTSITLGWFLEDEENRDYGLTVLARLAENEAIVPFLWTYEMSNGLIMAYRRRRITFDQISEFLDRLDALPIEIDPPDAHAALRLSNVAKAHELTAYDAAYFELATRLELPLATNDKALKKAVLALRDPGAKLRALFLDRLD